MSDLDFGDIDALDEFALRDAMSKGRRAWRRSIRALRDPGHLRRFYQDQEIYSFWEASARSRGQFNQFMAGTRHSCHCYCCVYQRKLKREVIRRQRHDQRRLIAHAWADFDEADKENPH